MARFIAWLKSLFIIVVDDAPKPHVEPKKAPVLNKDRRSFGTLYFREDLLDRLPDYMVHLAQMKRTDPDAWGLYRHIGGSIATRGGMFGCGELDPAWRKYRPAFGMVYLSHKDAQKRGEDIIDANFIYVMKVRYPRNRHLQAYPRGGSLYQLSCAFVWKDRPMLASAHLWVDRDGNVTPLKERGDHGIWSYPSWVVEIVKEINTDWNMPEKWLRNVFVMVANYSVWAMGAGIQVRATKGHITAVFGIHTERTPYFFADREKERGETGATKRIFHVARTHKRMLPDGREVVVPMHYRGLRKFKWHDCTVMVTVPGRDHAPVQEAAFTASVADEIPKGFVSAPVAGKMMADHVEKRAA